MSHGALYQLRHPSKLIVGQPVAINGPYDRFGYVVAVKDTNAEGQTLYLLRGTGGSIARRGYKGGVIFETPGRHETPALPQF